MVLQSLVVYFTTLLFVTGCKHLQKTGVQENFDTWEVYWAGR